MFHNANQLVASSSCFQLFWKIEYSTLARNCVDGKIIVTEITVVFHSSFTIYLSNTIDNWEFVWQQKYSREGEKNLISNALNLDEERLYATEPTVVSKDTWKQLHNNVIYKHTKNISLCPS